MFTPQALIHKSCQRVTEQLLSSHSTAVSSYFQVTFRLLSIFFLTAVKELLCSYFQVTIKLLSGHFQVTFELLSIFLCQRVTVQLLLSHNAITFRLLSKYF